MPAFSLFWFVAGSLFGVLIFPRALSMAYGIAGKGQ